MQTQQSERTNREHALEQEVERLRQENRAFNEMIKGRYGSNEHVINQLRDQLQDEVNARQLLERASARQYRLLIEQIPDGVMIMRGNALVFVNTALAGMLGTTAEHLLGQALLDMFFVDDKTAVKRWFGQLEHRFPEQCLQARCVTVEKNVVWIEGHPSLVTWEGEPAFLVTLRDISEHKQREITLTETARHLEQENTNLKTRSKERYRFGKIIGKSPAMQALYELIAHAAAADFNVAVYGESGTGKELIAQTIHAVSKRRDRPFVAVNCGAVPETLFESQFFGHRKGAFTGAQSNKQGYFEAADTGTLFLDEVGELSVVMQVKLLRALESGEYTPLGEQHARKVNVRIVAATNRDLKASVREGLMREDFFYRIHVITLTSPSLRDRKEDLPLLIEHFLTSYSGGELPSALPGAILEAMYLYDWPGNIRELQNELQRYLTTRRLEFMHTLTPSPSSAMMAAQSDTGIMASTTGFQEAVEAFEKRLIINALERQKGRKGKTAAALGINPKTLYKKMKKYHIL